MRKRVRAMFGTLLDRATRSLAGRLTRSAVAAERLGERLTPTLPSRLAQDAQRLDRAVRLLPLIADGRLSTARASMDAAGAALTVLGPQATLDRGYAIVRRDDDDAIVRRPSEAPVGTALRVRVARGELSAKVTAQTATPAAAPPARAAGPKRARRGPP